MWPYFPATVRDGSLSVGPRNGPGMPPSNWNRWCTTMAHQYFVAEERNNCPKWMNKAWKFAFVCIDR